MQRAVATQQGAVPAQKGAAGTAGHVHGGCPQSNQAAHTRPSAHRHRGHHPDNSHRGHDPDNNSHIGPPARRHRGHHHDNRHRGSSP